MLVTFVAGQTACLEIQTGGGWALPGQDFPEATCRPPSVDVPISGRTVEDITVNWIILILV